MRPSTPTSSPRGESCGPLFTSKPGLILPSAEGRLRRGQGKYPDEAEATQAGPLCRRTLGKCEFRSALGDSEEGFRQASFFPGLPSPDVAQPGFPPTDFATKVSQLSD